MTKRLISFALVLAVMLSLYIPCLAVDYDEDGYYRIPDGTYKNMMLHHAGIDHEAVYAVFWGDKQTFAAAYPIEHMSSYAEVSYTAKNNKTEKITMFIEEFTSESSNEYKLSGYGLSIFGPLYEISVKGNKITVTEDDVTVSGKKPKIRFGEGLGVRLSEDCRFYNGGKHPEMTLEEVFRCLSDPASQFSEMTLQAKDGEITSVQFEKYLYQDGYVPDYSAAPSKELFDAWMEPLEYTLTAPNQRSYLPEQQFGVIQSKGGKGVYAYGSPTGSNKFKEYVKDGEEVVVMAVQSKRALIQVVSSGRAVWVGESAVSYDVDN